MVCVTASCCNKLRRMLSVTKVDETSDVTKIQKDLAKFSICNNVTKSSSLMIRDGLPKFLVIAE